MGAALQLVNLRDRDADPGGDIKLSYKGRLDGIDVPAARVTELIDELPWLI